MNYCRLCGHLMYLEQWDATGDAATTTPRYIVERLRCPHCWHVEDWNRYVAPGEMNGEKVCRA